MKLPKYPDELVLERDRYLNKIWLHANEEPGFDMSTDGRVLLTPQLARRLAARLIKFADTVRRKGD